MNHQLNRIFNNDPHIFDRYGFKFRYDEPSMISEYVLENETLSVSIDAWREVWLTQKGNDQEPIMLVCDDETDLKSIANFIKNEG